MHWSLLLGIKKQAIFYLGQFSTWDTRTAFQSEPIFINPSSQKKATIFLHVYFWGSQLHCCKIPWSLSTSNWLDSQASNTLGLAPCFRARTDLLYGHKLSAQQSRVSKFGFLWSQVSKFESPRVNTDCMNNQGWPAPPLQRPINSSSVLWASNPTNSPRLKLVMHLKCVPRGLMNNSLDLTPIVGKLLNVCILSRVYNAITVNYNNGSMNNHFDVNHYLRYWVVTFWIYAGHWVVDFDVYETLFFEKILLPGLSYLHVCLAGQQLLA